MNYGSLKVVSGILKNVSKPTLLERVEDGKLVSPNQVYITKANIDGIVKGDVSIEIYGIVPDNYAGKHISVKQSSYKLDEKNLCLIVQEVYLEGNEILNQPVIFRA